MTLDNVFIKVYTKVNLIDLQGRVRVPTGGKARERKQIWCNSKADSIVWMKEDVIFSYHALKCVSFRSFFVNNYSTGYKIRVK